MKKIMKKALSLILVLALAIVPMTALAAAGDYVPVPSWQYCIISGDTVTVEAGATTYFEISTEGVAGTYDFVVEGTGAFDVAVCTEGVASEYSDGYAEGTPVAAVNGKVETTITSYESTYGYAAFSITNNSDSSVDYTCTVVFPEGTQGNPKAVTLAVGGTAQVTVPAGSQYYVAVTLPEYYMEYQLTITGNTGFAYSGGYGMPTPDTNGSYISTVAMYFEPVSFAIQNRTESEQIYTLALDNMPLGSASNPDELKIDFTTRKELNGNEYWYTWTAPEDGKFVIEMINSMCEDGWTYDAINMNTYDELNFSTGWYEEDKFKGELNVSKDDIVMVGVSVPTYYAEDDYYSVYEPADGTVVFSTSFVPGESTGSGSEGGTGSGSIGSENTSSGDNYVGSEALLVNGVNTVDTEKTYTIFTIEPSETAKYTFVSTDGSKLGIVSTNGMWVTTEPSEETVAETEVTWECSSVGQSMWLAVDDADDDGSVNILIIKEEIVITELPGIEYENQVTPEDFTFTGDADKLLDSPVDTFDDVADKAVLGDDGYYHLNAADGPILFVNLSDSMTSLVAAREPGQLNAINYDENGDAVSKTDFNSAFDEYLACADVTSIDGATLYPLTEDLKTIFQRVGTDKNWYGNGWVGGELEDAWMFACYYEEGLTSIGGTTTGGSTTGGTTGGSTTDETPTGGATTDGTTGDSAAGTNADTIKTGDSVNVVAWVAVMMLGLATVAVVLKKRAR